MAKRTPRSKRVYEAPARTDGARVLVDALWPRGVSKSAAKLTLWLKEIAPSAALRKWFDHDAARWAEFCERYDAELDANDAAVEKLRALVAERPVTLLYGARDTEHNQAVALLAYLKKKSAPKTNDK